MFTFGAQEDYDELVLECNDRVGQIHLFSRNSAHSAATIQSRQRGGILMNGSTTNPSAMNISFRVVSKPELILVDGNYFSSKASLRKLDWKNTKIY